MIMVKVVGGSHNTSYDNGESYTVIKIVRIMVRVIVLTFVTIVMIMVRVIGNIHNNS